MAYANGTTHYNLPLTVGTDIRDWSDTNEAFNDIDAAIYGAVQDVETAGAKVEELDEQINTATTGIAAQLSTAKSDIISLAGRVTTVEGTVSGHTNAIADVRNDLEDMVCAYNEASAISTHNYDVGKYFIYNDIMYRCTEAIAVGDTIIPNTNCKASNITTEILDIMERLGNVDISDYGANITDAVKEIGDDVDVIIPNILTVKPTGTPAVDSTNALVVQVPKHAPAVV